MVKTTDLQSSFRAGILGVAYAEREDTEDYYEGARDIHNMDPRPQGGAALRPGTAYYGRLRNVLEARDLSGATLAFGAQTTGGGTGSAPAPPTPDPDPYIDLPPWVFDFSGLANIGPG